MISDFKFQISNFKLHAFANVRASAFVTFLLFTFYFLLCSACVTGSIPNLDTPECEASRLVAKQFYSYHFGNEMKFSQENLKQREKFLTPEFYKSLQNLQTENDVFTTNSTDLPRAFKLGACKILEPTKTDVEIQMFWKDIERIEQRNIHTEIIKQGDKWLINKVLIDK